MGFDLLITKLSTSLTSIAVWSFGVSEAFTTRDKINSERNWIAMQKISFLKIEGHGAFTVNNVGISLQELISVGLRSQFFLSLVGCFPGPKVL